MDWVIETKGLSRRFGRKRAVSNLSLRVARGSTFAFLGPNGAGKTTTIKMLMNLIEPSGGEAMVLGVPSRELQPKDLARIGYVSENQVLPQWMTVRQLIDYCRPLYPTWDAAFCDTLQAQLKLPTDRKIKHLSRGMKVKAALLVSLSYRPELLVLDEPFSGLDPVMREDFIRSVVDLTHEGKWTVFISSHDIDEVERIADWVGIVNLGELVFAEEVASLQARFRRIEVTLADGADKARALKYPVDWFGLETTGNTLRFVDSRYDEAQTTAKLRELLPTLTAMNATPMSLREIYIAQARTFATTE